MGERNAGRGPGRAMEERGQAIGAPGVAPPSTAGALAALVLLLGSPATARADEPAAVEEPEVHEEPDAPAAAPPAPAALLAGELAYAGQLIGFARPAATDVRALMAFQGAYEPRSLAGAGLYQALGRPDLLRTYERLRLVKLLVLIGGAAILAAGTAVGVADAVTAPRTVDPAVSVGGLTGIAVGASLAVFSFVLGADPIDEREAKRLVDDHNRALRARLGLPPRLPASASAPSLSLAPIVGPRSGGLTVTVRF